MIHMRSCEGTPAMPRGRLVERPEKRRGLVGSSLASAQGGHLLILKGGAFAVKSTLPYGSNALPQALFTIQPKDRCSSWTMRDGVVGGQILDQHLPGGIWDARIAIAALSNLVEQPKIATSILCFGLAKGRHPVLNTASGHGDCFATLPGQDGAESPISCFQGFRTSERDDLSHRLLQRRGS